MLNTIRSYAGSLPVRILFILLVLSFVLWGIGDVFSPGRFRHDWIARVGDVTVSPDEFAQNLDRTVRGVGEAMGTPIDREQARALGLVDAVLNQMVSQALLDQAAADLGLAADDAVVRAQITSDRRFRGTTGAFDAELFRRTLAANGLSEARYVELLRGDIVRSQLVTSIGALPGVPHRMVELIRRYEGERRIAAYVLVPDDATPPPAAADDATLRAYHQNQAARFTAPEYRSVSAILIRTDDLADGIAIGEDELRAAYDEHAADFTVPERRTFRQVVLMDRDAAQKAHDRLAQGASLASVSAELLGSAAGEPAAINVGRADLPAPLADALFALTPGKVAGPIETALGWHVLVLDTITPEQRTPFEQARARLKAELARERASDAVIQLSDRLDDILGRGASFEQAATELGLSVRSIEALDARGNDRDGRPVADLLPNLVATAFATPEGSQSLVTEAGDQGYFVVRVDRVTPEALKPFETVRADVAAAWRRDEIARGTEERANRLAEQARGGRSLAELAREARLEFQRSGALSREDGGREQNLSREFVTALFASKPGEIFVIAAPTGRLVGALERIEDAPPADDPAATADLRRRLANTLQGDLLAQYLGALRQRYAVAINQEALAKLF